MRTRRKNWEIPEGEPPDGDTTDAEEAVVGAVLLHGLAYNDVSDILSPDGSDFKDGLRAKVWAAICSYAARLDGRGPAGIDLITVAEEMRNLGTFEALRFNEYEGYLIDLSSAVNRWDNIRDHALIVQRAARYRQAVATAVKLQDQIAMPGDEDSEESKDDRVQQHLSDLNHILSFGAVGKPRAAKAILSGVLSRMEATQNVSEKFINPHISTGNERLDTMLRGGHHVPCYTIIAARPSMGKTATMVNQILAGGAAGIPTLVLSLETAEQSLMYRMMAVQSRGRLSTERLAGSQGLTTAEWIEVSKVAGEISRMPVDIEDFSQTTPTSESVISCIERWRANYRRLECPVCLSHRQASDPRCDSCGLDRPKKGWPFQRAAVWVDHFGLVQCRVKSGGTSEKASAEFSQTLQRLSKRLHLLVVALCQLNRKVEERKDKRPMNSDLRETGSLEQDGDVIVMLYRDEHYERDSKDRGIIEMIVSKQRDGAVGTVRAGFQHDRGPRIVDIKE